MQPTGKKTALAVAIATVALGLLTVQALGSFGNPRNFPAGSKPRSVIVGQFNADSKRDLAVTNSAGIAVLNGNGNGTFGKARAFAVAEAPEDLVSGRFNADSNIDLAVTGPGSNVSILAGNGKGGFGPPAAFTNGPTIRWSPRSIATGDMNGDAQPDVVTTSAEGVSVLNGVGDGSLSPALNQDIGGTATYGLALGDLNGDRNTDVVFGTGAAMNFIGVLIGTGDGKFSSYSKFPAGTTPNNVALGYLNGDRILDIAAANSNSNSVSVLLGNGDATFRAFRPYATARAAVSGPGQVAISDLNADGRSDLAVANGQTNNVGVLTGRGDGTFSGPTTHPAGRTPLGLATGNLNAGSDPDLVTANYESGNASVLLNAGPSRRSVDLGYRRGERRFVGKIRSADPTCVSRQRVRILKRRSGTDRQVRSVISGQAGNFRAGFGVKPGAYYARVRPWSACRATNSPVVRIRHR